MSKELLDDINYTPELKGKKHLKNIKPLLFSSLGFGVLSGGIIYRFTPLEFAVFLGIPDDLAGPLVLGTLGIAGFLMAIVLYKRGRYWAANRK